MFIRGPAQQGGRRGELRREPSAELGRSSQPRSSGRGLAKLPLREPLSEDDVDNRQTERLIVCL
jgi:hypothetical protein